MNEKCGSQDQIWAAYGGFNSIDFRNKSFKVNNLNINSSQLTKLSKNLFLIYTGINKFSHTIEKDKISNFKTNIKHLSDIYELAKDFKNNLLKNNEN